MGGVISGTKSYRFSNDFSVFYSCSSPSNSSLSNSSKSIVVLEGGFGLPGPALEHVQNFIASKSGVKTCVYEPRGTGWSGRGNMYNFQEDAGAMKAVLDSEINEAGWEEGEVLVFAGGHSRGHLTGTAFYEEFREEYKKVILVGLDGTSCLELGEDMRKYGYAVPFLGAVGGYIRLLWPLLGHMMMAPDGPLPEGLEPDLSPLAKLRYLEISADEENLLAMFERSFNWAWKYDGPSYNECTSDPPEGLGLSMNTQSNEDVTDDQIYVCASCCCTPEFGCAEHTSLITVSHYANIATDFVGLAIKEKVEALG